ncbi:hypothetical protein [Pseudomonas aeruginosa]|uniref:hypothetical protein n=1 Tax=Pseudomonas aeruginosa TaxID=287 RepID=UPI001067AA0F|nr:hypothetical protein [Pseudomonas aeruginosa]TEB72278.1 hypothetical protein IPC1604_28215 [Pseudomonas aeruginosa]TEC15376.1 hypothetical protein IPC1599_30315 [Pseudomonas aeruginosa]
MKSGYLYYASDKAVYDALVQHNFKNADVREIFLSRGILISDNTPREDIALYFSSLNHDYYDHQRIASIFGGSVRKERTALARVKNSFDKEKLEYVGGEVKKQLESTGAQVTCAWIGKSYVLTIKYEEYNSNKSEFKQTIEREGVVEIDLSGSDVVVRYSDNKFVSSAKEKFLDVLSAQVPEGEGFDVEEISLKGLSGELRTDFFKKLLVGISGYKPHDVSDVYVYNPKSTPADSATDTDLGVHITKVSFKGEGVLSSSELEAFFKAGFYINRVVWTCWASSERSDIFELDVHFSNPEECEGFAYVIRGVYKLNDKGSHNKGRTPCDTLSDKRMIRLIEDAASKTLAELRLKVEGGSTEALSEAI